MLKLFKKSETHQDPVAMVKQVDTSINLTSITIPKYRVKGNFVEYVIECTRISTTWQVFRRYQQFKALDQQLRALCGMGSAHHCEFGVVPMLCGSHWTEVTNQSPELVERRRRYLEIYLQQLLVPKNLFYAAKTPLYNFLHDGEVPILYKSRAHRPLIGLSATVEDGNAGGEISDEESGQPKQVVASNSAKLLFPESVVSSAIPDYSSSSANRANFAKNAASGEHIMEPAVGVLEPSKPTGEHGELYKEKCTQCGIETVVDYEISEWTPEGRCANCKTHSIHVLLKPDGSPAADDKEVGSDEEAEYDDDDEAGSPELSCSACRAGFSVIVIPHICHYCKMKFCGNCSTKILIDEGKHGRCCARCKANLERHQSGLSDEGSVGKGSTSRVPTLAQELERDVAENPPMSTTDSNVVESLDFEKVNVEDFELVTTLGRGTFGKVMKVKSKMNGKVYAMKVLNKTVILKRRMVDYIKEEKNIMSHVSRHPFIVTLHHAFQTEHHIFFVLDYLPGGELYTHIYPHRNLREADAQLYIAEVVLAVEHLHKHDVVHRDIKPENIVLDRDGHLKLTDFGLARMNFTRIRRRSFVGSAEYLAPETIQGDVQTKALDWWSVGVMLFEMLSGAAPFHASNNNDVYQAVLHKKLDFSKPCFSPHAQSILQKLLDKDPKNRLSDPAKIKSHPFFASVDWTALFNGEVTPPFVPNLTDNDTKYFNRDFTSEWATIQRPGGVGRQTIELLTRRFSNFRVAPPTDTPAKRMVSSPTKDVSSPTLINPDTFIGVWRLVKVEMVSQDGKVCYPWGSEVIGMMVYCSNGMFTLQLCPMKRQKFRNANQDKITREEMAEAYLSYIASFGTYEVIPGKNYLLHHATGGICPNLIGIREKRFFDIVDDKHLTIMTPPVMVEEGVMARTSISWEKVV